MKLCEKLNCLIAEKNISQADLCRMTGISTSRMSQIFTGATKDPRLSTIILICDALEITPGQLVEDVDFDK